MTVLTPPGYVQGGTYSAKLDRVYIATLGMVPNLAASFSARQGFHVGRVPAYANPSGMNVTMGPCSGVIANTFASASGDYLFANDATVQVTPAASSPTQNRYDIIGFQIKDNLFDSSGLNTAVPAVIQGANSAGTPSDPVLPSSFIPVVRAVINATVTSPTLQSLIRKTTSDGGLIRINGTTERTELTPFEGMQIYREDRDWVEIYDGAGWRVQGIAVTSSTADRDATITSPYNGQLAFTSDTGKVFQRAGGAWREFPAVPLAQMRQTVVQTLANVTFADITFTTEDFDTYGGHSTSVNTARFTAPAGITGVYEFSGGIAFAANATGIRLTQWAKNGAALPASDSGTPSFGASAAARVAARTVQVHMVGGSDYVTLQGFQDRGGDLDTFSSGAAASSMTVKYIGS